MTPTKAESASAKVKPRADIRVDAVFDLETEGWDKIVFAGLLYSDGEYRVYDWKNIDDFWDALIQVDGDVWAHYGGGFDIKAALDEAIRRRYYVKVQSAGSLVRSARICKVTLRDSFALFPDSLARFTEGLGIAKQKLSLPCDCGEDCGGYCSIARDKPQFHTRIKTYLKADCQSLFGALAKLREWAARNDVDLCPTVGSSAWRFASRRFGVPNGSLKGSDFWYARSAYYGGRCEVFRWGAQSNVFEYDVRSMYPWALWSANLPWGSSRRIRSAESAREAFEVKAPGCYDVTVHVPPMHIPPLPWRTKKRIYYPTGTFRGTYTLPELEYAISLGCEIKRYHGALVWSETKNVFRGWADEVFRLRHEECGGPDTPLGIFAKFLSNSASGKLGQNPERFSHEINPNRIITCKCPPRRSECKCNPHIQLSDYVYKRRTVAMSGCMHPIWAAYLTSISRVKLHMKMTERNNGKDCCYTDTDSAFVLSLLGMVHPREVKAIAALGDFEYKGTYKDCYFAAPKVYTKDGKVKAKGIKGAKKLAEGKVYTSEGIIGFGQGARTGKFFAKGKLSRRIRFHAGGRIVVDSRTGETRPMTAREALADSKKRDKIK